MTEVHTLKERLEPTVLVLGTAIKERVDDLSDILDAVTQLEMRLFKYAGVAVSRSQVERKNGQLVSHPMFDGQPVKWPQKYRYVQLLLLTLVAMSLTTFSHDYLSRSLTFLNHVFVTFVICRLILIIPIHAAYYMLLPLSFVLYLNLMDCC